VVARNCWLEIFVTTLRAGVFAIADKVIER